MVLQFRTAKLPHRLPFLSCSTCPPAYFFSMNRILLWIACLSLWPLTGDTSSPTASVAYARNGRIEVIRLGEETSRTLGKGQFVRWGPEGHQLAVVEGGTLSLIKVDGSERRVLAKNVFVKDGSPIEFHPQGQHILYLRKDRHFHLVDIKTGESRSLAEWGTFTGEPCFAEDGRRLVAREGHTLWNVDTRTGTRTTFGKGCSPMMTADGRFLLHNLGGHQRLAVKKADGTPVKDLSSQTLRPDRNWDNHHASNHPDYLAAQGEKGPGGAYIVRISDNRIWRAGPKGKITYPDVFIHHAGTPSTGEASAAPETAAPLQSGTFRIQARLKKRTPTPSKDQLQEYRHALVTDLYVATETVGNLSAGTSFVVIRWAVRDRKVLPPRPTDAQGLYQLNIASFDSFPDLRSERLLDDVGGFETPRYLLLGVDRAANEP